jgi:hypothetical protein
LYFYRIFSNNYFFLKFFTENSIINAKNSAKINKF